MSDVEGEHKVEEVVDEKKKRNKKYKKDKPWDTDDIDHWKVDPVTAENPLEPPLEESVFATLFPKYREPYLREVWPLVTKTLKEHGIACELNLLEGSMTVKTTKKMIDPYMIIKAYDLIKLLSRSVPVQQALKILDDNMSCEIIKIKGTVRNKDRFAKRRARLIGPNGCTLKAIELVTECYVLVQGNTVSAMGHHSKLHQVRKIVINTMNNVHPIYMIKELMIKNELAKDPQLKNENWDRFLPKIKKKNVKSKKPHIIREKKEYTPFPAPQLPRKVDLEMESGAFWLKGGGADAKAKKDKKREDEKRENGGLNNDGRMKDGEEDNEEQREKVVEEKRKERQKRKQDKMDSYVAPEEKSHRISSSNNTDQGDQIGVGKKRKAREIEGGDDDDNDNDNSMGGEVRTTGPAPTLKPRSESKKTRKERMTAEKIEKNFGKRRKVTSGDEE